MCIEFLPNTTVVHPVPLNQVDRRLAMQVLYASLHSQGVGGSWGSWGCPDLLEVGATQSHVPLALQRTAIAFSLKKAHVHEPTDIARPDRETRGELP